MSEDIFMKNLIAFRKYAVSQGAHFNEHGYLVYRGKILTRADSEYLAQSDLLYEKILDESEIKDLFDNLVDYIESYEVDES
jgi:hypothetical protein